MTGSSYLNLDPDRTVISSILLCLRPHSLARLVSTVMGLLFVAGSVMAADPGGGTKSFDVPASGAAPSRAAEEEPIALSPFVVTTDQDRGYLAANTLSGTRLRTELEDVAASVSVVTKEMLDDTGVTNLQGILVQTVGTEATGVGGNYSGSVQVSESMTETGATNNPDNRVRGLGSADQVRNYFRSLVPIDTYNTNRIDINRGANAILFGVGSPAGIIDRSTNLARLDKQTGEVVARFDQFGSYRSSLDFNQPIVKGQLAVRLNTVYDERIFQQKPAFNRQRRIYGTVTAKPKVFETSNGVLAGTTIRGTVESGSIDANNPRSLPPQDRISLWWGGDAYIDSLDPAHKRVPVKPTHSAIYDGTAQNGLVNTWQNTTRSPIVWFPDPNSAVAQHPFGGNVIGGQAVITNSNKVPPSLNATSSMVFLRSYAKVLDYLGDPTAPFYKAFVISDPSVFDFYHRLLDGPNKSENSNFRTLNASVEQLFLKGKAGVEFAYDKQLWENAESSLIPRAIQYIAIDINTVLWDGTPNPNFGRTAVSTYGNQTFVHAENEAVRATGTYQFDTRQVTSSRWADWLGRHTVSTLWQKESTSSDSRVGRTFYIADAYPYGNSQSRVQDSGKVPIAMNYLGSSIAGLSVPTNLSIPSIGAVRNLAEVSQTGVFQLRKQGAGTATVYQPLNILEDDKYGANNSSDATLTERRIESSAIALQSYVLQNQVVGTIGWRRERVESRGVSPAYLTTGEAVRDFDSGYDLPVQPDQDTHMTVKSWGLVAKTPAFLTRRIPGLSGLNFNYGRSENFSPPERLRRSLTGGAIDPPAGETEDYGVTLKLADNRVVVRLNWYESFQRRLTNSSLSANADGIIARHIAVYNAVRDHYAGADGTDLNGDGWPDAYTPPPQSLLDVYQVRMSSSGKSVTYTDPNIAVTSDYRSKGFEAEVFVNLNRSWTLALNAAKAEAVRSNTGEDLLRAFLATPTGKYPSLWEAWSSAEAKTFAGGSSPGTFTSLAWDSRKLLYNPILNETAKDNTLVQELRKWRANLTTNYRFRSERLKGFGVGGSVRWQDRVAIGNPVILSPETGEPVSDRAHPILGPYETDYDAWLSYSRKILRGRYDWKIQLNVRDLFNGDGKLVPVAAQPDGRIAAYRIASPTTFTLTNRIGF